MGMMTSAFPIPRILGFFCDRGQDRKPAAVLDRDDALIWLDGGKRIVGRQDVLLGQRVEQRRLAHIGQADDADG